MPARSRLQPLLLALALAVGGPAAAQDAGFEPRTGDAWIDTWLGDVNRYGHSYREPFVDELARYHGAPRDLVVELLGRPGWTPGDVYFACSLATVAGRPCRHVADEYDRSRDEGWGALARRLGVEPGSVAFQRIKRGFVPTYDRWSRPIRLDDELLRAFPARGRGKAAGRGPTPARGADASPAPAQAGQPRPAPAVESGKPPRGKEPPARRGDGPEDDPEASAGKARDEDGDRR